MQAGGKAKCPLHGATQAHLGALAITMSGREGKRVWTGAPVKKGRSRTPCSVTSFISVLNS